MQLLKKSIFMSKVFGNRLKINPSEFGFSNHKASGKLPKILPSPLLLNLGCGKDVREGFINIDLFSDDPRVVYMDIRKLEFEDNSVDFILASDILEHFSHREVEKVLTEWVRVLKPNGEIIIRSPSLKLQANAYLRGDWDAAVASYMIYGGQTNPGDYHCVGFDQKSITILFEKVGLELTSYEEQDIPQNKGYINLNFIARGKKKSFVQIQETAAENLQGEESVTESNAYNIAMLEELVGMDGPEDKPKLNIVWEGSQFIYHSLALINRELCSKIIDSKVANLTIIPYEPDQFAPIGNSKYEKLAECDIRFKPEVSEEISRLPYLWIRHQWPPKSDPPKGAKWVIMQPWEFSQLRRDFVEFFAQANQIWTPSNYSRQCIVNSGIDFNKVQIVPNGVDPIIFKPIGEKYNLNTYKKLKFLYCGGTIYRKGIDILLRAYLKAFNKNDEVCLVVKDMGGESFYRGQNAEQMIEEIQKNPNAPEIIYIKDYLNEEEIASLYRACNVFVSPYRGEGFSLPTLEAMACGLPVIVTEGGATEDFTISTFSVKIPSEKKSIGNRIGEYELTGEAYLLEPNEDDLVEILKRFYKSPNSFLSRGLIASAYARQNWNWRNSALKMFSLIDGLYETNLSATAQRNLPEFSDYLIELGRAEDEFINDNFEIAYQIYLQNINNIENEKLKRHINKRIVQCLLFQNEFENARKILDTIDEEDDYDKYYLETLYFSLKNQSTEALEFVTKSMNQWGVRKFSSTLGYSLDDLLVITGNLLISTKENYIEALDVYELALKENPENSLACYGAAMALFNLNFLEQAKTMVDWAIKLDPNFQDAILLKDIIEGKLGKDQPN